MYFFFGKREKLVGVAGVLLSFNKHTFLNGCGWKTSPYVFCRVGALNIINLHLVTCKQLQEKQHSALLYSAKSVQNHYEC